MSDPIVIRASALSGYADCPRRGAARLFRREIEAAGYVLRETARGIGAAIGTAVHHAAQVVLGEKARTGTLPPVLVATDCAIDDLREAMAQGVAYDGSRGLTQGRADAERQTLRMTAAYHRAVAPTVAPILVEGRLEAEVAPGLVLSGQPDIVAREPGQVRDLKTGARPGHHAPQIGAYSLLARTPTPTHPEGIDISRAAIDFVQRVAPGKPQPDPVSYAVALAAAETAAVNIVRHIADDLRVFREGDSRRAASPGDPWAFLANPSSMLCSVRWCPAHGTDFCTAHRQE